MGPGATVLLTVVLMPTLFFLLRFLKELDGRIATRRMAEFSRRNYPSPEVPLSGEVVVRTDPSTFRIAPKYGTVTGVFFVRLGEKCFPEENWEDFPLACYAAWLNKVPDVLSGAQNYFECPFVDGPFALHLEQRNGDVWDLSAMRTRGGFDSSKSAGLVFRATVSLRDFIVGLLSGAEQTTATVLSVSPYHQEATELAVKVKGLQAKLRANAIPNAV